MTISYNDDPQYGWTRLQGSYVRLQGSDRPVYIREMDGTRVYYTSLCGDTGDCRLSDLNLEPVPMGNMNQNGFCHYITRLPSRSWRQGFRTSNIAAFNGISFRSINIEGNISFLRMVLNQYPSIDECFEDIYNGEVKSQAFTKNFSLGPNKNSVYKLFHKNIEVGSVQDLSGAFDPIFGKKYEWLAEKFGDEINA